VRGEREKQHDKGRDMKKVPEVRWGGVGKGEKRISCMLCNAIIHVIHGIPLRRYVVDPSPLPATSFSQ
jgi:hypothetical protein